MRTRIRNPYLILLLLTGLNMLNFIDRYVPAGALRMIGRDLNLSETQKGALYFSFLILYTLIAPITGLFGDRIKRIRYIVISGVIWSLATAGAFFAPGYKSLMATRAFVGVGEAVFGILAPTIIVDLFSHEKRGRVLAFFYLSIPLGGAIGYMAGGMIGDVMNSWRIPFLVVGLPGLFISLIAGLIEEPDRGTSDEGIDTKNVMMQGNVQLSEVKNLFFNPAYMVLVLGLTCATWVQGGLSWWMPNFYAEHPSLGIGDYQASYRFGMVVFSGGLLAIPLGGLISDWLAEYTEQAPGLVSGAGMLLGSVPAFLALVILQQPYCWFLAFGAILGLFLNTGPINAAILEVVPVHRRAAAIALSILIIHIFGDVISPMIIGVVTDLTGHLQNGLFLAVPIMFVGGIIWIYGARWLPDSRQEALSRSKKVNEEEDASERRFSEEE